MLWTAADLLVDAFAEPAPAAAAAELGPQQEPGPADPMADLLGLSGPHSSPSLQPPPPVHPHTNFSVVESQTDSLCSLTYHLCCLRCLYLGLFVPNVFRILVHVHVHLC